jgi:hypothetical protein
MVVSSDVAMADCFLIEGSVAELFRACLLRISSGCAKDKIAPMIISPPAKPPIRIPIYLPLHLVLGLVVPEDDGGPSDLRFRETPKSADSEWSSDSRMAESEGDGDDVSFGR